MTKIQFQSTLQSGKVMSQKPRLKPVALAFGYSEPCQSHCWTITNGLAWPGRNRLSLARLMALVRARQITKLVTVVISQHSGVNHIV